MNEQMHHDIAHASALDLMEMFHWPSVEAKEQSYAVFYMAQRRTLEAYDTLARTQFERLYPLKGAIYASEEFLNN